MPMHHRQRFDQSAEPSATFDYTNRLRSLFHKAVGCALASSLATFGCGESHAPGGGLPVDAPARPHVGPPAHGTPDTLAGSAAPAPKLTPRAVPVTVECQSGIPRLFAGVSSEPFDAAALLIQSAATMGPQLLLGEGVFCASAKNVASCQAEIEAASDKANLPLADACGMYGMCTRYVLTTHGDEVHKYQSRKELLQFLGPIDSPEDVLLLLYYDTRPVACATNGSYSGIDPTTMRELDDGFEVVSIVHQPSCAGPRRERVTQHIAKDGSVTETKRESEPQPTACPGRRPAGLRSRHIDTSASALGEYFARMAHLEHASIAAFEVLARELEHHGAPAGLIAAARSAAADEVRHAATTSALAREFGAKPSPSEVAPQAVRSLEAIAIENVAEGCVRECFGAALGSYQAACAADPAIAAAMAVIAEDETRHAALAFAVDVWTRSRLDDASRARVAAARVEAVDTLRRELAYEPDPTTRAALGLPEAHSALRLFNALEQTLWVS